MKLILTEAEMMNVLASLSREDIESYISGKHKFWVVDKYYSNDQEEGYNLEYIYDEDGNIKSNLNKEEAGENDI